jgi:hypothetical protein
MYANQLQDNFLGMLEAAMDIDHGRRNPPPPAAPPERAQ